MKYTYETRLAEYLQLQARALQRQLKSMNAAKPMSDTFVEELKKAAYEKHGIKGFERLT